MQNRGAAPQGSDQREGRDKNRSGLRRGNGYRKRPPDVNCGIRQAEAVRLAGAGGGYRDPLAGHPGGGGGYDPRQLSGKGSRPAEEGIAVHFIWGRIEKGGICAVACDV